MKGLYFCLALGALPALGQVGSTAIYTGFEEEPPADVVESMKEEVAAIMEPAGLRFAWRSLNGVTGNEVFSDLAVARFKGRCDGVGVEAPRFFTGALAWSHVTEGEVLPFTDVDCDRIRNFLNSRLMAVEAWRRNRVFGRAIGRVLAHELYHIFSREKSHGSRDVDKPYYTAPELVSDEFGLDEKEPHILRTSSAPAAVEWRSHNQAIQAGRAVYAQSGCGSCHGAQGQGTRKAPALRGKGPVDSVVLAARLERNGPTMCRRAREEKLPAPSLGEEQIADLVRYLNAPPD